MVLEFSSQPDQRHGGILPQQFNKQAKRVDPNTLAYACDRAKQNVRID